MKEANIDKVNDLILDFIPEVVMQTNPIIAGGFARFLYITASNLSSYRKIKGNLELSAELKKYDEILFSDAGNRSTIDWLSQNISSFDFHDIDIWFLHDNKIWEKDNKYNEFVSRRECGMMSELDQARILHIHNSEWANTCMFIKELGSKIKNSPNIQFIFGKNDISDYRKLESIDFLLNSFDIDNVKVAWMNNKLFVADEFLEAEMAREIRINKDKDRWAKLSPQQRILTAIRVIKYAHRTGFDISKNSVDLIFEVYNEVISDPRVLKCFAPSLLNSLISRVMPNRRRFPGRSGLGYSALFNAPNKEDFLSCALVLLSSANLITFISQKHFDKEAYLPFFLGTNIEDLNKIISTNMEI